MENDLQQEDEYVNRKFIYYIEIKNNKGLPTRFKGSQSEFEKRYLSSDTCGKVVDYIKTDIVNKVDETICNDKFSPYYGRSIKIANAKRNRWGDDVSEGGLNRSNTNKRYFKYL